MHPVKTLYQTQLKRYFPPVKFAFAYGSAVFTQSGRTKGKMLDVVFAVDDPVSWHNENLKLNPYHYSALRYFGSNVIWSIQACTAGVYYNTLVNIDHQLMKYGVISKKDLLLDLNTWKWLYISGRLHKPVVILTDDTETDLLSALDRNNKNAALCGLYLLSEDQCTEEELYTSITGLSYQGDFRMHFGEDKNKVSNLVNATTIPEFKKLYEPHLRELVIFSDNRIIKQADSEGLLEDITASLPFHVVEEMKHGASLQKVLSTIVWKSSIKQSSKGIITSGLIKSIKYSTQKIKKMFSSTKVRQ